MKSKTKSTNPQHPELLNHKQPSSKNKSCDLTKVKQEISNDSKPNVSLLKDSTLCPSSNPISSMKQSECLSNAESAQVENQLKGSTVLIKPTCRGELDESNITTGTITPNSTSKPSQSTSITETAKPTSRISIKVKFRPSTKEGSEGVLYFQFTQSRKTTKLNTPFHLFPTEWNKTNNKIIFPDESCPRHDELNAMADDLKWELKVLQNLSKNATDIKSLIEEYQKSKEMCNSNSLYDYARSLINKYKKEERFRAAETLQSALNRFMRFRGGRDILIDRIDRELMEEFQQYLLDQNLTLNTVSFYMRKLRAVFNQAVKDNLCVDNKPFSTVYTSNAQTKKRALSKSTLRKIASADLSDAPKLKWARDMFTLILFFQGISFVDLAYMHNFPDETELINYNRRKTGSPISIFLEEEAKDIIKKYRSQNSTYLLSIITSSDNQIARRQCQNALARVNYSLKKLTERLGLNINLTTYVARHTWATLALANGTPIETISEALGHQDIKTTRIYIESIHSDAVTKANRGVIDLLKEDDETECVIG